MKKTGFKNLLPPLVLLKSQESKKLLKDLNDLKFEIDKNLAA